VQTGPRNFVIISKKEPNLDYFSEYELKILEEIINRYGHRKIPQKELSEKICDDSHVEIKAWQIARDKGENSIINYDYAFDKNLFSKPKAELTTVENTYLIYKYFTEKINAVR